MERILAGYYIGDNVKLEVASRKISGFDSRNKQFNSFILRDTMLRLFMYMLENGNGRIITNEQLLINVWDLHGLKSSGPRLWQVMQGLKFRLAALGVPHDFIMKIETFEVKGYSLKSELIRPFYFYS